LRPVEGDACEWHGRADDLVLDDEVLGPQLAQLRVVDQARAGRRVGADDELELAAEAGAGRQ
jgi:hypothetical protein